MLCMWDGLDDLRVTCNPPLFPALPCYLSTLLLSPPFVFLLPLPSLPLSSSPLSSPFSLRSAPLYSPSLQSSQCNVKCKNLDADLQVKTEQLRKTSESLKKRNKEVKRLRCAGHGTCTVVGVLVHSATCVWITLPFHSPPPTLSYLPPSHPFSPSPPQGGPVQCAGLHGLHGVPLLRPGSRDAAATGETGAGASRSVWGRG